jgi:hypothetical protein
MNVELSVEWELAKEALGSNLGRRSGKPATNRLSYGTAPLETLRCSGTSEYVYKSTSHNSSPLREIRRSHVVLLVLFSYFSEYYMY